MQICNAQLLECLEQQFRTARFCVANEKAQRDEEGE